MANAEEIIQAVRVYGAAVSDEVKCIGGGHNEARHVKEQEADQAAAEQATLAAFDKVAAAIKAMADLDMLRDVFGLQSELNDTIFKKQGIRETDRHTGTVRALRMADIRDDVALGHLGPNDLPNIWLRNYLTALKAEGAELEESLLWKWWSKDKIDIQNIRVEIVDLMHFLTSLALSAGLTAEEFHRLYTAKHRVNHNRQDQGYAKDNKNEADNKTVV